MPSNKVEVEVSVHRHVLLCVEAQIRVEDAWILWCVDRWTIKCTLNEVENDGSCGKVTRQVVAPVVVTKRVYRGQRAPILVSERHSEGRYRVHFGGLKLVLRTLGLNEWPLAVLC